MSMRSRGQRLLLIWVATLLHHALTLAATDPPAEPPQGKPAEASLLEVLQAPVPTLGTTKRQMVSEWSRQQDDIEKLEAVASVWRNHRGSLDEAQRAALIEYAGVLGPVRVNGPKFQHQDDVAACVLDGLDDPAESVRAAARQGVHRVLASVHRERLMPRLIAAMSGDDPDWFAKATETLSTGATYDARVIEAIYGLALAPTPRQRESLRVIADDRKPYDSEIGPRERAFWVLVRYIGWVEALRLARQTDPDGQRAFAINAAVHWPSGRTRIPWEAPDELWPQRSEVVSFFLDQLDADPQVVRRSSSAQSYLVWIMATDSLPLDLRCRAAETLDGLVHGPSPLDPRVSNRLLDDVSMQWERMWLLLGTKEAGRAIDVDSVRRAVLGAYAGPGDPQPSLRDILRAKGPPWTIRALASIQAGPPDLSGDARSRVHRALDHMWGSRSVAFPPPVKSGEAAQALIEYAEKAPPGHAGEVLSRLSGVYAPRVESMLEQWITDERRCSAFVGISDSAISKGTPSDGLRSLSVQLLTDESCTPIPRTTLTDAPRSIEAGTIRRLLLSASNYMLRFEGVVRVQAILPRLDAHALAAMAGAVSSRMEWERGKPEVADWRDQRVHEMIAGILEDPRVVRQICPAELAYIISGDIRRLGNQPVALRIRRAFAAIRDARSNDAEIVRLCDHFLGGN